MTEYTRYTRLWLEQLFQRKRMPKSLFFWGHKSHNKNEVTKACLSQWWPSEFTVNGDLYYTAEHWMMVEKARLFGALDIAEQIMATKKPGAAKAFGRQIENFDQFKWDEHKYDIVVRGSCHKFSQNPKILSFLAGTSPRILIEASPVDKVWGIGLEEKDARSTNPLLWNGENLLGFALMSARDMLLAEG